MTGYGPVALWGGAAVNLNVVSYVQLCPAPAWSVPATGAFH